MKAPREKFGSEAELAAECVAWLIESGWEIYQEVAPWGSYGNCADIVAVRGQFLWVVETKLSMSLALLDQAIAWRGCANYVSVCVPKSDRQHEAARRLCRHEGIGIILISPEYRDSSSVASRTQVSPKPRLWRRTNEMLREALTEAHKTYAAAGNADGKRWSPFQQTVRDLTKLVAAEPGITMREALGRIETHYATRESARAQIVKLTKDGVIQGVRIEREGRAIRLYPS